tara:strand:- start:186 stop:659 length:474 start_codon:yes stop_codon:yes gene_type:complete
MNRRHSNILKDINNNKFINELVLYQKTNPCCKSYPNCGHPPLQSDSLLHKKYIKLKESLDSIIKNIAEIQLWTFITLPKMKISAQWHSHQNSKINKKQLSALCYLTETDVGTEFKNGFVIKPKLNNWYIWDSNLIHRPEDKEVNNLRITLGSNIYLK